MKKTLLLGFMLAGIFSANAQIADGTQAPDFTATDINGNVHHLQEYLDAGKTVIIDVSATWCGPCWTYHGSHALSDLYESYGPNGTEDVVVLFIEGDPGTSVESIYGTNTASDESTTRGDWTQHSPYPIIDDGDGSISEAFDIAYFPTVFMICPEGTVKELTQPTVSQLKSQINTNCQSLTSSVLTDKARPDNTDVIYCETDGEYKSKIKNLGTNKIMSATLVLKENGTVVGTKTYSSTSGLNQYSAANITFDNHTFIEGAEYTTEVTEINGLTTLPHPEVASLETSITVNNAAVTTNNFTVEIYTDNYPSEATWEIRTNNTANTLVASGGPYAEGPEDFGGGGADANTVKTHSVTLPEGSDCYKVILKDSYGDGWIYSAGGVYTAGVFHGMKILSGGEVVFEKDVNTFTFTNATYGSALITNGTLSTPQQELQSSFAVYPNPTNGILNIHTDEVTDVRIMDLTGKVVFTATGLNDGSSINLSSLQKGMYMATFKGSKGDRTEKIVIN